MHLLNLILFLKVADCVPIYLFDKRLIIFGLVHSGWRGTANKIVMNAINNLLENGSNLSDILISLGPAIGICCYEVGEQIIHNFHSNSLVKKNNSYYLDLSSQLSIDLINMGIYKNHITHSNVCTSHDEKCHSFRRDGINSGRMHSMIIKIFI